MSAGLLAGCLARPYDNAVNTSLDKLALSRNAPTRSGESTSLTPAPQRPAVTGDGLDIERYAQDLQALLEADRTAELPTIHAAPPAPAVVEAQHDETVELALAVSEASDAPVGPIAVTNVADDASEAATVSLDELIATRAAELRALLRQRSVGSLDPLRDEAIVAVLDVLAASTPSAPSDDLAPAEREAIGALRDFMSGLLAWSSGSEASEPADLAHQLADRLAIAGGLRIREAVLCSRVQGFGRFTPHGSTTFLAGRQHRVFLYTEIERFSRRAIVPSESDPAEWAVEISQELNLWHDAPTPILAWRRSEERVIETFRGQRRDFYLVHTIDLPRTLTVGAYMLKVIVRDKVNGSHAEAVIPIRVVADPGLLNAR